MSWLTIESDPAVFTTLISDLGVKDILVEELFSVDAASIDAIQPNYGVIFLFKYQNDVAAASSTGKLDFDENIWFAHQIIQNACGTQALLAILLNHPDIDIGSELAAFRDFTLDFPADLRGETMTNSDLLRTVHNSFSKSEMFYRDEDERGDKGTGESPHHFIAYARIRGRLYELDGLKAAPIDHGPCDAAFGAQLEPVLQERIARYAQNEVHFNLLALTQDPLAQGVAVPLDAQQRAFELERKAQRLREVEMRRHNFAGAIVEVTKSLLRTMSPEQLESAIAASKERTQARVRRNDG